MIDPEAAAEELERCVTEHGFVGMVCPQHVLDKNLDDPSFDIVWATADRLGVAVTVHGGGQAQGQVPFVIERLDSTLTVHAFTHPVGAMLAVTSFTVGGVLASSPEPAGRVHGSGHRLAAVLARAARRALGARARPGTRDRPRAVALLPRRQLLRHVRARREDGSLRAAQRESRRVCYASDYCHWDCIFPDSVRVLAERDDLEPEEKERVFARNAAALYGLDIRVTQSTR